jgi:hypothetical protein
MSEGRGRASSVSPLAVPQNEAAASFARIIMGVAHHIESAARSALARRTAREGASAYLQPARGVLSLLVDPSRVSRAQLDGAGARAERELAGAFAPSVEPGDDAVRSLVNDCSMAASNALLEALQGLTALGDRPVVLDPGGSFVGAEGRDLFARGVRGRDLSADVLLAAVAKALSEAVGPAVTTGNGLLLPGGVRVARAADQTLRAWLDAEAASEDEALTRSGLRMRGSSFNAADAGASRREGDEE